MDDETFQFIDRRVDRSEHDIDDKVTVCAEGQLYLTVHHVQTPLPGPSCSFSSFNASVASGYRLSEQIEYQVGAGERSLHPRDERNRR